jgi:hypothetical protein
LYVGVKSFSLVESGSSINGSSIFHLVEAQASFGPLTWNVIMQK